MKFMLTDNIMVKNEICTAGSKILYNFKAPFSSTVYDKCISADLEFKGLVITDEFGIDNLFDKNNTSYDAIDSIKNNSCDVVLCNDIFGKIQRDAALNGLVYIHPSYGTVSRYGLIPSASSMDQIGVLCRSINDGIKILNIISGYDEKDGCSLKNENYDYRAENTSVKTVKIDTNSKYFDVIPSVFYNLAAAEICNNTNRYDGVKFGFRAEDADNLNDLYLNTRSQGFGRDVQLASIFGCMALSNEYYDKYYDKSMRIRRLVKEYYDELLSNADVIELPVITGSSDKFSQLSLYALKALCGYAGISITVKGVPLQLITKQGNENKMLAAIV